MFEWKEVACWWTNPDARFWTLALSPDGNKCLGFFWDNTSPMLFEVDKQTVTWDAWRDKKFLERVGYSLDLDWFDWLEQYKSEKRFNCNIDPIQGSYLMFGLLHNEPKRMDSKLGISLELDESAHQIILKSMNSQEELQRLDYQGMYKGDWLSATFSDDGSTIVVAEPLAVTFFQRVEDIK